MATMPSFSEVHVEALAEALGACDSESTLTRVLHDCQLANNSGKSTFSNKNSIIGSRPAHGLPHD
jgi:hypothetical protein